MAFHFSRRKLGPSEPDEANELNVVPYLDILMNLIIFMLLSMAGLATWGMVKVEAARTTDQPAARTPALILTVAVAPSGFVLTSSLEEGLVEIPRSGGRYDFDALALRLSELKTRFPAERSLIISADPEVEYDAVIATMDAARETADRKPLFPDVTLAHF